MKPKPPPAPDANDDDLGEPVAELSGLASRPGAEFGKRVRRRIERRRTAGEFLELAWSAPLMVVLELLRIPLEILAGRRRR